MTLVLTISTATAPAADANARAAHGPLCRQRAATQRRTPRTVMMTLMLMAFLILLTMIVNQAMIASGARPPKATTSLCGERKAKNKTSGAVLIDQHECVHRSGQLRQLRVGHPTDLFGASIKVSGASSSNIKLHWRNQHTDVYKQAETANGKDEKFKAVENAVKRQAC